MRRRQFIAVVGGAAACPLLAHAQAPQRMRRLGVFMYLVEQDQESKSYIAALMTRLKELGCLVGTNVLVDYRWTGGDTARIRQYAAELVALTPDVILAAGGSDVGPLQQVTRTIPIVFVQVADAVGGGFVESLARPGGNRAAMPQASRISNSTLAENGYNCSSKSPRASGELRFSAIPSIPAALANLALSKPWRERCMWT
jgi:ABC-type uncharacterized transport system substrate-binding protein